MNDYSSLQKNYGYQLKNFKGYLLKQGYKNGTVDRYVNYTLFFFNWKNQKGLDEKHIDYTDLLSYIHYCRENNNSTGLINTKLLAVRKYYTFLQLKEKTENNPASGIYLKGKRKSVPVNILSKTQLENIYSSYPENNLRNKRNKAILSLLVYQGIRSKELQDIKTSDIDLENGKLTIPAGKYQKSRILKLEAVQILKLHAYLKTVRPAILKNIEKPQLWPGKKATNPDLEKLKDKLFISLNGSENIKNVLQCLIMSLKKINHKVESLKQIRQSVITHWLKYEDLRKVQYKAGHSYVSTTERYQVNNLEDLQLTLNKYHPLK